MLLKKLLLPFVFCFTGMFCFAQKFTVDIKDLSFIAGKWIMKHEWGDMEENWSMPMGNSMMCSYRCVNKGKAVFYEFMLIEQTDSVPVLLLRHMMPGNIAEEDKEHPHIYPLVKLEANKASFENIEKDTQLIFVRPDKSHMTVILKREKAGAWKTDEFAYTLAK